MRRQRPELAAAKATMSFLLLYIDEGCKFDKQAVTSAIRSLNGAKLVRPDDDCLCMYDYAKGNDATTIRLMKDKETIAIDGTGDASLYAALHIQAHYPEVIHMIDEAYSFDLVLRGIGSLGELEQRIKDVGG